MKTMKAFVIIAITLCRIPTSTDAQSSSPWQRNSWTDELCTGSSSDSCRILAEMELRKQYDALTSEGQIWIRSSCPDFWGFNVDGCVYRNVRALMRPGWPRVDRLDANEQKLVWKTCPRSLGPNSWRECAEIELAKLNAPSTPVSLKEVRPGGNNSLPSAAGATMRSIGWSRQRPPMPGYHQFGDLEPVTIFRLISPAIYLVISADSVGALKSGSVRLGSAVAVSEKHAMTNCHIMASHGLIALVEPESQSVHKVEVIRPDDSSDRCFLETDKPLQPVPSVRPASSLKVGERVYTIGNPAGLTKTLGEGLLSGLRQQKNIVHIQVSAPISHGSSGGALVDANGSLIGITTFALKNGQNLNFAIAADEYWK